jgi:glycosyltransferase involved in cell wall biosynthesis
MAASLQSFDSDRINLASSRPLRVCFVGLGNLPVLAREYNHHSIGGEQVQQTLLACALAREGYDVSMVTADYGQPDGAVWEGVKVYKAYAPNAGVPVVRFIHPRWTGVWNALQRADADVYYVSCAGAIVGEVAMFCRKFGRKMIFRVASDRDCEREGLLIKYWRDKKLYQYGLRRADGVLAQSAAQINRLRANYSVSSRIAGMLVEQSDNVKPFAERDWPALWINNFRPLKRPELYLELASRLPELAFHIVGGAIPGQEAYYEASKARAASHANAVFHGAAPYHNVNPMYGRAKVFVNTSEIEGFPNSYLQAWMRGTPVITFIDPDGLIAREGLGAVVRDTEELVEAVRRLCLDPKAWREASDRCRAYMLRHYGDAVVLKAYRELIDELTSPSRREG